MVRASLTTAAAGHPAFLRQNVICSDFDVLIAAHHKF
jgi:hypothetical protein